MSFAPPPVSLRSVSLAAGVVALAMSSACGRAQEPAPKASVAPARVPWAPVVQAAGVPVGAQSAQPQVTRHAGGVVLSWLEHGGGRATLKFAERTPAGWSPVRTVASGKDWFVSWADVPSVARLRDGTLVAQWLKNVDPLIEAYDLILSYSRDDGRTWARPFTPHHDKTRTQHGFASLFEGPDGGFGVVWLDGRDMELNTTDPEGGSMALYAARFDASGRQLAEEPVNGRVCECCSTSVALTPDGPIAAFRDRSPQEIRDIHVSRFQDGAWTPAVPVHADNWRIDACPVNGPAIGASGSTVAVAWFTATSDEGHAYAAFSKDAGRTWGEPIRLDDKTALGHVAIDVLDDGAAVASWVEFDDQRSRFLARRIEASGQVSEVVEPAGASTGRVSGQPRLSRVGNDLVFAWTESTGDGDASQQVKVATAPLPSR